MKRIKNAAELLSTGDRMSRQIVLEILDETLDKLYAYNILRRLISLEGNILTIGNRNDPAVLFDIIAEAVENNGYTNKVCYSMDCAASEFYNEKRKTYEYMGSEIDSTELIGRIQELTARHPFFFVEDILSDCDFEGFAEAASAMPGIRMIGDDLICTNIARLDKALQLGACEGMIFKPNQIGTISESLSAYDYARSHEMLVIPSVRAGGTIDDPVKDMAIGLEVPLVKCGAPRSGERISFLNTLLRASDEFPQARFQPLFSLGRTKDDGSRIKTD